MTGQSAPHLEDILDAFAMEEIHAKTTLDRYLAAYPQFAGELIDLSRELLRADVPDDVEPALGDAAKIDAAWTRHAAARPRQAADPFAALSPTRSREVAAELGVPRQVVTAFRERRIQPTSVPRAFVRRLAGALMAAVDDLITWMTPEPVGLARSYRSNGQPAAAAQVTFERILIDAGVTEADRARLLADET